MRGVKIRRQWEEAHISTHAFSKRSREEAAKRPVHFNPFHKREDEIKEEEGRGGLKGEKASNKL